MMCPSLSAQAMEENKFETKFLSATIESVLQNNILSLYGYGKWVLACSLWYG